MRLTYKAQDQHGKETGTIWYASTDGDSIFPKSAKEEQVLKKLAAYEDTGLEPDVIKEKVGFMSPVCVGCDGKTADGKRTEKCTYDEDFRKCLERSVHLSELAHAEEKGRLVILPCKVGDTLYEIDLPEYGVIVCNVLYVDIYNGPFAHVPGSKIVAAVSVGVEVVGGHGKGSSYSFEQDDFGKTVFLSRAEAEAALRKEDKA